MKYLGIDFGEKRIGIALSDPGGLLAFPKTILLNKGNPRLREQLNLLLTQEKVSEIVIGVPLSHEGKETIESGLVRKFAEWLKTFTALPIIFQNEILTTKMAMHPGVSAHKIDAASAALILQLHLDKENVKLKNQNKK